MKYNNWNDFFNNIPFTFFKTSLIQQKYIETIYEETPVFGKILEIAGGSGYTSAVIADFLRRKETSVTYSDLEPNLVNKVKEKFSSITNLKFTVADSYNLPFKNNEFDIIFHQGFLEHFSDAEIINLLIEQSRVAKKIVFDVPNSRRWHKIQEFGNERFLTHEKWQHLVLQAGLIIHKVTARRFSNPWKRLIPEIIKDTEWFHRNFGESTIIVCGNL